MASIHYYFGTKRDLIEQLIVDAAICMENRRAHALTALADTNKIISVRDIIYVLVAGSIVQFDEGERNRTVIRFLGAIYLNYRPLFDRVIGSKYNKTWQTCLSMIRERVDWMPLPLLNTRFIFLSLAIQEIVSAREAALDGSPKAKAYWASPEMVDNIVDSLCGLISAPAHNSTLARLAIKTSNAAKRPARKSNSISKSAKQT
jgi:AcrR family transcriptional regulator